MFSNASKNVLMKEAQTRRLQFVSTSYPIAESIATADLSNNGYALVTEKSNQAKTFMPVKVYQDIKWYNSEMAQQGEIDYSAPKLYPGSSPPVYNSPTDGSLEFTTPAVTGLSDNSFVMASMYWDDATNNINHHGLGAIRLKQISQNSIATDINVDDLNVNLGSSCTSQWRYTGTFVYNQPSSLSIINFPNNGFLVSWTQEEVPCTFSGGIAPGVFCSPITTSIHIACFDVQNKFVRQITVPGENIIRNLNILPGEISYYVTLTSMIYLHDSSFVLAYHLTNTMALTAIMCQNDPQNFLLTCGTETLFKESINGERFVVRLAALLDNPVFVWESENSNQNSQIFIKFYNSKEQQTTYQVSSDESDKYYNINPAVIVLENSNTIVIWHRYLKEGDTYVGLMMQQYSSDLSPMFLQPITIQNTYLVHYLSSSSTSLSPKIYNFPQMAALDNNNFIIHWLDEYGRLASADTFSLSFQQDSLDSLNKNTSSNFSAIFIGIVATIGMLFTLFRVANNCMKNNRNPSDSQYVKIPDDIENGAIEVSTLKSSSSIVNPFSTFQNSDLSSAKVKNQGCIIENNM